MPLADETDDLEDVRITTLKQWLRDRASEQAWRHHPVDVNSVDEIVERLLETEFVHAREFVEITGSEIIVGVNAPQINDHAINRAILMLIQLTKFDAGTRLEFGHNINVNDDKH